MEQSQTYTAFLAAEQLANGPLDVILPILKAQFDRDPGASVLVFDDRNCRQVDFDLRGSLPEVLSVASAAVRPRTGPGRPRLGVVSREVSLLPRHWEWLEEQPNGASAALRRLVDQARNHDPAGQRTRLATEAAGRFMTAMAGNLPGYEEASRTLYAGNRPRLEETIRAWPPAIRAYLLQRLETAAEPAGIES